MNIMLIIEGTYPWYRGGVSEWVFQYLKHLKEFNFTILQIATDEFQGLDPSEALYPIPDNVGKFFRISPPDIKGNWQSYLTKWYQELDLSGISKNDTDVIHVANTGFAGWIGSKLSKNYHIPMILTEHAIYWKEIDMGAVALECGYKVPETQEQKDHFTSSFQEIAAYTYSNSDQVITVSKVNIPYQNELGATNIRYIPNGVCESWIIPKKKRGITPTIGWVGRCAEMKNPLAFFDLVDAFKTNKLDPQFIMLLSDANEKDLEERVRGRSKEYPNVELVWNQPSKAYFSKMDMLCITSHNESQPLVMLEAIASRALPIGKQVGDFTSSFGLTFDPKVSYQEMADTVTGLWNSIDEFEDMVNHRISLLKKNHLWDVIFSKYKSIFELTTREKEGVEA